VEHGAKAYSLLCGHECTETIAELKIQLRQFILFFVSKMKKKI